MLGLSFEWLETRNSPYINRFLQPDTVIPDLSNPQSWNRYSYVTNRPVNFNDPSGHRACDEDNCLLGTHKLDKDTAKDQNEDDETKYHSKSWLKWHLGTYHDCSKTYKECFDDWGLGILELSEGQQINPEQFEELMRAVYYDLKIKDKGLLPLFSLDPQRNEYDTPFWNPDKGKYLDPNTQEYVRIKRPDVNVCFGQNCYRRSDVNYFAQGMWAAISGQTLDDAISQAANRKANKYGETLSADTSYWITFGYNKVSEYDSINLMDTLQGP